MSANFTGRPDDFITGFPNRSYDRFSALENKDQEEEKETNDK
ncbi:hypothetical protein JOC37_001594 [Desulfohalotomaculum tongense]|nr:hypothetical protein [Desulforadius tongensis]MBM7855209.1 hypothetical protein [Desulforadius tongensis]